MMPDSMPARALSVPAPPARMPVGASVLKAVLVNLVALIFSLPLVSLALDFAARAHPDPAATVAAAVTSYARYEPVVFLLLLAAFLLCVAVNGVLHAVVLRVLAGQRVRVSFLLADFTAFAPGAVLSRGRYLAAVLLPSLLLLPAALWLVGPATLWLHHAGLPPWTFFLPCLLPAQAVITLVDVGILVLQGARHPAGVRFPEEGITPPPPDEHADWLATTETCYRANPFVWQVLGAFTLIFGTLILSPLARATAVGFYRFYTPGEIIAFLAGIVFVALLLHILYAGMVHISMRHISGSPSSILDIFIFAPRLGQLAQVWTPPMVWGAAPYVVLGLIFTYSVAEPSHHGTRDPIGLFLIPPAIIAGIITLLVMYRSILRSLFAIPMLCKKEVLSIDTLFVSEKWLARHRKGLWRYLIALFSRARGSSALFRALIAIPVAYFALATIKPLGAGLAVYCLLLGWFSGELVGLLYGLPWLAIGTAVAWEAPAAAVPIPRARMGWLGRLFTLTLFACMLYLLYRMLAFFITSVE